MSRTVVLVAIILILLRISVYDGNLMLTPLV